MQVVERGQGPPLVFVPGVQGRWEYARPTIDALATHFRVITFSLHDDPSRGFDSYGDQVLAALEHAAIPRAIICGLSFGGLVALNFASRYPERVAALILTSTPGPGMTLRRRHELYTRLPWLFAPVFFVEAPLRARAELKAALPRVRERLAFGVMMLRNIVSAPVSPARMASRARLIASYDAAAACAGVTAPTLIVTGEPALDFVVKVDGSAQYARLIAGARSAVLERTGHQGTLTRPNAFAEIVHRFVAGTAEREPSTGSGSTRAQSRVESRRSSARCNDVA